MTTTRYSFLLGASLAASVAAVAAQVPVTKEPHHRTAYENADLRILDINIPAGEAARDHMHDRDISTVSMSVEAEVRSQDPGKPWVQRPRRPLGDTTVTEYAGKAGSHTIEVLGKTTYQLFGIENLRASGWSTTPALTAPATTVTNDTRAFRTYDIRLAGTQGQTSHTHTVPTVVVLIGGRIMSDGPDAQAKALAPAAVGLKQLDQPGQWLLVPRGDTHHLVRLGTADARVVEVEVR